MECCSTTCKEVQYQGIGLVSNKKTNRIVDGIEGLGERKTLVIKDAQQHPTPMSTRIMRRYDPLSCRNKCWIIIAVIQIIRVIFFNTFYLIHTVKDFGKFTILKVIDSHTTGRKASKSNHMIIVQFYQCVFSYSPTPFSPIKMYWPYSFGSFRRQIAIFIFI